MRHENYSADSGAVFNDIAVLHVEEPFEFDDTRQRTELFNEEARDGAEAVITGWGSTGYNGFSVDQLQAVDLPIVSKSLCNEAYEKDGGLTEGQICAAVYGVGCKDGCQGDSG